MGEVKRKQQQHDMATVVERKQIGSNWQQFLNGGAEAKTKKFNGQNNSNSNTANRNKQSDSYHHLLANIERKKPTYATPKPDTIKDTPSNVEETKKHGFALTQYIAMDCEMVGVGESARDHMLARVSLVNKRGECVYDTFVRPREEVTDYRTPVSGVRKEDLANGRPFERVQKDVADILKGRILVGHSLKNDIAVLYLSHPASKIRDTAKYQPFRKITNGSTPSLKRLCQELLGVGIQSGEHSSVEDARAAMQIYCLHSRQWELSLAQKRTSRRFAPGATHHGQRPNPRGNHPVAL